MKKYGKVQGCRDRKSLHFPIIYMIFGKLDNTARPQDRNVAKKTLDCVRIISDHHF